MAGWLESAQHCRICSDQQYYGVVSLAPKSHYSSWVIKEAEDIIELQIIGGFGDEVALASSGVEDVALIEYARATGRPFRMLELNFESGKSFDHAGFRIEYSFMDATIVVQGVMENEGLIFFHEDDHKKCFVNRFVLSIGSGTNPLAEIPAPRSESCTACRVIRGIKGSVCTCQMELHFCRNLWSRNVR